MKIGILIDSSATNTPDIFNNTVVENLPLHVNLPSGEDLLDTHENWEKYKIMELVERGEDLKTSQASPGEVGAKYDEMLKKYDHVIHIPITNNLSSMLQTAFMVSQEPEYENKVTVFMNEEITANVIEKAALILIDKLDSGEINSPESVIDFLKKYSEESIITFIPGDLKRLNAGGRAKKMLASVLSLIRAKVVLRWGQKPSKEGIFRTYRAVVDKIIEIYEKEGGATFQFIFLRSEKFAEKSLEIIRNALKAKKIKFEEKLIPNIYLVHAGIDSLAFLLCKK